MGSYPLEACPYQGLCTRIVNAGSIAIAWNLKQATYPQLEFLLVTYLYNGALSSHLQEKRWLCVYWFRMISDLDTEWTKATGRICMLLYLSKFFPQWGMGERNNLVLFLCLCVLLSHTCTCTQSLKGRGRTVAKGNFWGVRRDPYFSLYILLNCLDFLLWSTPLFQNLKIKIPASAWGSLMS